MNKLMVCGFAALALTANAVEIIDLTAAARKAGSGNYAITASSKGSYGPGGAFDGEYLVNSSLQWISGKGVDQWIQYQFKDSFQEGKVLRLTSYRFGVNTGWSGKNDKYGPCNLPSAWEFLGSNDGEAWDVLDAQSGRTVSEWTSHNNGEWVLPLRISKCYRYYRLHMTASLSNQESDEVKEYHIPEIMFWGEVCDDEASITKFRYWQGGTTGDWNEPTNWAPDADGQATVPQNGEYVWLGDMSAASISLSADTAELAGLILGGQGNAVTLTATGWEPRIRAEEMFVRNLGTVTSVACTEPGATTNRVHIVCGDLTVEAGGKIDVAGKGYQVKCGPGAGSGQVGGSHAGHGGGAYSQLSNPPQRTIYGNAEFPETLGSGGSDTSGSSGGGVIRIEASGLVTVNGTVTAAGQNMHVYGVYNTGGNTFGAGAGGSVWISCADFAGKNGTVSAAGGGSRIVLSDSGTYAASQVGCPGGGGRLAIHVAQGGTVDISGMTFSAASGDFKGGTWSGAQTYFDSKVTFEDRYFCDAGLGSLWFSDNAFLAALQGDGALYGQVRSVQTLALDSVLFKKGFVRFGEPGTVIDVAGDVVVTGDVARLEIGGDVVSNRTHRAEFYTSAPVALNVGGNLFVADGGRLDVRAAATNGTDEAGAYVDVAGDFTVGAKSSVYCWSEVENGGSPLFKAANVVIEEGALVSADARGFGGGWAYSNATVVRSYGFGPGGAKCGSGGATTVAGAGHGGNGGNATASRGGLANDDPYHPTFPGSGGGASWKYTCFGGAGGGVVNIAATNAIVVNGTISANGEKCTGGSTSSGAGGTVLLSAPNVSGAATGCISARGAESLTYVNGANTYYNGSAGGGRVVISTGCPWFKGIPKSRMNRSAEPIVSWLGGPVFEGTVDVAGGPQKDSKDHPGCLGEPGTCWFVDIREAPGVMLLVR